MNKQQDKIQQTFQIQEERDEESETSQEGNQGDEYQGDIQRKCNKYHNHDYEN